MNQSQPKISIIIPCYNCVSTLEDSLASIETQHFTFPFEIILVNDGSTDGTSELIASLIQKYSSKFPSIRSLNHDKNRGGGAARNTGIKNSSGKYIFCLDSDNILAPHTLRTMVEYAETHHADGVAFYERRFFGGTEVQKYKSHFNKPSNTSGTFGFSDVWNGSGMLLDNFVYTRESYEKAGGYPTDHGFDTQAFEIAYLGAGNKVWVCPDTHFYHRQNTRQKSYFERVYENGEFSINYYLAIEKVLPLLSNETIEFIVQYNIFNHANIKGETLKTALDELYARNKNSFLKGEKESEHPLTQAVHHYDHHEYRQSISCYEKILAGSNSSPLLYFNILRNCLGISGKEHESLVKDTYKLIAAMTLQKQDSLFEKKSFAKRMARNIRSIIKR